MYSSCSIEKKTEAVRGVMAALHACLDVKASRYRDENVLATRDADYAHRAAMAAVKKIKNAMDATDTVRHAVVNSSCRDRAVLLSLSMQEALDTAEGLVVDTKQCMDEIEQRFVDELTAREVELATKCAYVDGMTPEKARHFYDTARGTKRAINGEHIVDTATRVALGSATKKRLLSECDDETPFLAKLRLV
jgi:hypothetical protein